jgi:NAD-dependent DNA ligase/DNA polymerase/3'-5' exonuclease PolX
MNQQFIHILNQLADIMSRNGEPFRAKAYHSAQETISSLSNKVLTKDNFMKELKGQPGIGPAVLEKLNEFCSTGTLSIIEREKNNPVHKFCDIYGVGPKKAKEIVDKGVVTIEQLRLNADGLLNDTQKTGLRYYEDILERIPRAEIDSFKSTLNNIFLNLKTNFSPSMRMNFEIVGSYRRGAQDSGDIDVIVTSQNSQVFSMLISALLRAKIILEVLSQGTSKCLVIAMILTKARRVDFLFTTHDEFPFSILYFTGSKNFNTAMRGTALTRGYTMNEHGICRKDGTPVEIIFKSEREIFDFLHLEYKEPWERVDGRDIVLKVEQGAGLLTSYRKHGLTSLSQVQLEEIIETLNNAYHNSSPLVEDNEFDAIKDYYENKYKKLGTVGAAVASKVTLPYLMASMDKIKPDTDALINWTKKYKGPYLLSCKVDGVSGLYSTEGNQPKLYTRGDGCVGQDISHLIPHLRLPREKNIVIRGEFLIKKDVFLLKYKGEFKNPRNMVAGIVNQKSVDLTKIKDVQFVAYEVLKPVLKPSDQMAFLQQREKEIDCVQFLMQDKLTNDSLSSLLLEWRKSYLYEIDGIIVAENRIFERTSTLQNPCWAFAFKMILTEQIAEAHVLGVIWTPSKDGYLKPRVQISPVSLGGVLIEYATGFNGAFIEDNKIGVGTIIEIIRSGDVIPHIRAVKVSSSNAMMPSVPYKWNDSHVDVILENMDLDDTVREKNITCFFKGIEVDGLGSGNVNRIIQAGFTTVEQIINMTLNDFLKVEGFQLTMATKIHDGIRLKLEAASLLTLMSSSNLFGRGFSEKKIEVILSEYPTILMSKETKQERINKLLNVKGFALKTAEAFVEKIPDFLAFLKRCALDYKLLGTSTSIPSSSSSSSLLLEGKTFVLTGFRDKELEEKLKSMGAKIGSSVSKNTYMVVVKDMEDSTQKMIDAKRLGINIVRVADLALF